MSSLQAFAVDLRSRHFATEPLILANVWDAVSARAVADAGHPVLATSSAAVAASIGRGDHEQMSATEAFEAVSRIARAAEVPVSADMEAGYGLSPRELVDRLLEAGAVGCNLEDSDHRGPGGLTEAERQADYLAAVSESSRASGVEIVINARVDVYLRGGFPPDKQADEALRRGRLYLAAGATCVYPIGLVDEGETARLVEEMGGPLNVWLRPDSPPLDRLRSIGVARISTAAALQRHATSSIADFARSLLLAKTSENVVE